MQNVGTWYVSCVKRWCSLTFSDGETVCTVRLPRDPEGGTPSRNRVLNEPGSCSPTNFVHSVRRGNISEWAEQVGIQTVTDSTAQLQQRRKAGSMFYFEEL